MNKNTTPILVYSFLHKQQRNAGLFTADLSCLIKTYLMNLYCTEHNRTFNIRKLSDIYVRLFKNSTQTFVLIQQLVTLARLHSKKSIRMNVYCLFCVS